MDEIEIYDTVTLASGRSYPCDYLATIPIGMLFVSVASDSIAEVSDVFSDPAETARILYGPHILTGYTVLVSVSPEAPGRYKIALRRAFVGEEEP